MTHFNPILALSAGALLCGLAAHGVAGTADGSLAVTSNPGGFLTQSDRRAPTTTDKLSSGLADRLCARATRDSRQTCAPSLHGGAGFPDEWSAGLPHLRLNIILRKMRNVVVAGSGVNSLGAFQEPWGSFKITSSAADVSIPTAVDPPYGLPLPPPNSKWDVLFHNGLFQGVIHNGCMGVPATFDLTLDSSVYRISTGVVFGSVHVVDEVEGWGYYNFEYTIRARDENGNVSDFIFSGDADSFCTGQAGL